MRKESLQEATQRALIEGYKNLNENKSKKIEAKLEDIQMEIYEMIQTARKVDKQDKDTNKRETAYAIMQEYPEINRKELINYISKKADEIYAGDYDEKTESKKVEDVDKLNKMYEQGTTDLEKAFETEVRFWLEGLVGENSTDEIGKQAQSVLDDNKKVKNIVDELVNGSDDLWEDIHMKIEELAGIDYRVRANKEKFEGKKVTENVDYSQAAEKIYDESTQEIVLDLVKNKDCDKRLIDIAKSYEMLEKVVNEFDNYEELEDRFIELDTKAEKIIAELANIDYAELGLNEGKKVTEGKDVKSIVKQVLNALNKYDEENVSVDEDEETGNISIMFTSSNNSFPIAKDVCNVKDINVSELVKELDDRGIGHCLLSESK